MHLRRRLLGVQREQSQRWHNALERAHARLIAQHPRVGLMMLRRRLAELEKKR